MWGISIKLWGQNDVGYVNTILGINPCERKSIFCRGKSIKSLGEIDVEVNQNFLGRTMWDRMLGEMDVASFSTVTPRHPLLYLLLRHEANYC